jgi:hypothetical protein
MTTIAQVKQLVKPLLQRNSDLGLVGRWVIVKPVHHILRGVSIDRRQDPKSFVPTWAANFLFQPNARFHFFWGTDVHGTWNVGVADVAEKLADAIEREALPTLRSMITVDDFATFAKGAWPEDHKPYVDAALGHFDAAQSMCGYFATLNGHYGIRQEECEHVVNELCPLVTSGDRPAIARLLHRHEEQSVRRLKLDKLWQPTPFPIEAES